MNTGNDFLRLLRFVQSKAKNTYQRRYGSNSSWITDPTYRRITPPELSTRKWSLPKIPANVVLPSYAKTGQMSPWHDIIPLAYPIGPAEWYDEYLLEGMRQAGRTASECLTFAKTLVEPGITTREIDAKVIEWIFSRGWYPSSMNYGGFQGAICTSVNNVVSHGVPNEYQIPLMRFILT